MSSLLDRSIFSNEIVEVKLFFSFRGRKDQDKQHVNRTEYDFMRFQLIHVAVFPFQSEAKIVLTSSIVSLIELLCVFCWYYVTVDYVVIILSSVLVQRILFIHLMIYILLKITQYAFDRRTIGADRREYGQNPRRHDGRRESVEWNGKMLWNLRTPVEKVRFYFRIALNSFYKKKTFLQK